MDSNNEQSTCETMQINQDFIKTANQLKAKYLKIKNDLLNEILQEILQEKYNSEKTDIKILKTLS